MVHRRRRDGAWLPIAQLLTVMGLVFAVEHWGLALMVALSFTISLFAWGILGTMWGDRGLVELPRIIGRGSAVGLMATALAGLATTWGTLSLFVAAVLTLSHPLVKQKLVMLWSRLVSPAATPPKTDEHRQLSDAELCTMWKSSHAMLRTATTPADKAAVVQLRQDCLDELQRRHPDGLAAWMASGALADDNPQRFLTRSDSPEAGGP
ncbi:MAG: hypothetical protein ABWX73_14250 [Marmoricola sp.]